MGSTLDYYTCGNWMKLVLFAAKRWQEVQHDNITREEIGVYLREVAQYAFDFGFSLRQGDRLYGFLQLVSAIGDERIKDAYYKLDSESWLTPSKSKPPTGDGFYYVLATPTEADRPFYVTVGTIIGDYMGQRERLTWNGYGSDGRAVGTIFKSDSYTEAKRVRDLCLAARGVYSKVTTTTKPPTKG